MNSCDDVYLVSDKRQAVPNHEFDELASWLGIPLPLGYRECLATLGVGTFCDLVNVHPPKTIRDDVDEYRAYIAEYYREFFGPSEKILPFECVIDSVCVATSLDGDLFVLCRDKPDRVYILPRNDEYVYWLERSFEDPLGWKATNGQEMVIRPPFRYFEPWQDRRVIEFFTAGSFDMDDLAERISSRWHESRSIRGEYHVWLFAKDLGGRLQLTQNPDDRRVGIRLDYDADRSPQAEALADELKEMGFFETGRHPEK